MKEIEEAEIDYIFHLLEPYLSIFNRAEVRKAIAGEGRLWCLPDFVNEVYWPEGGGEPKHIYQRQDQGGK